MSSGNGNTVTQDSIIFTKDVIVTPLEDLLVEGTESYILSIAMVSGPVTKAVTNTITVSIADNEGKDIIYNASYVLIS